ncbi:MAG: bacillithiol system redox-active protein YtxJ [Cyclobacteriaceae bacterium]
MINWKKLETPTELKALIEASKTRPVIIFKHSTRCSISSMALSRLERDWKEDEQATPYFVDLVRHRDVSNAVAETFNIRHESPQLLLIKDGQCIYDTSHMGISYRELQQQLA